MRPPVLGAPARARGDVFLLVVLLTAARSPGGALPMPRMAIGAGDTACSPPRACEAGLREALRLGFRHVDTAWEYGTQGLVGEAVRASGLARGEVFVTTKVPGPVGFQEAHRLFREDLQQLGMAYVDLLLMHYPCSEAWPDPRDACGADEGADARLATWRALEEIAGSGAATLIGVSNFNVRHLRRLLSAPNVTWPAVNQVEWHMGWHDDRLLAYCQSRSIALEAYSPLGGGGTTTGHSGGIALDDPVVAQIAGRHNITTAQLALRWSLQQGVAVIVGTTNPRHMAGDLAILEGPVLSAAEVRQLSLLHPAVPSVRIADGWPDVMMPMVALRVTEHGDALQLSVTDMAPNITDMALLWIEAGGRHLEVPRQGQSLQEMGRALSTAVRRDLAARDELFLTAKVEETLGHEGTRSAVLDVLLPSLGTRYVDLVMVQRFGSEKGSSPTLERTADRLRADLTDLLATWSGLEELRASGHIRALGVCGPFSVPDLDQLLLEARASGRAANLSVAQAEWHPGWHDEALWAWTRKHNVTLQSGAPLGGDGAGHAAPLAAAAIRAAAAAHDVTPEQVALRWSLQRGAPLVVAGARAVRRRRSELAPLFGFALAGGEMAAIDALGPAARPGAGPGLLYYV